MDEQTKQDLIMKVHQQATNDTLIEFCITLADVAGVKEIEGLPPNEWFVKRKRENVEKALIRIEDFDPLVAAKMSQLMDERRKRKGGRSN